MTLTCPACRTSGLPAQSRFCLACGGALPEAEAGIRSYTPAHLAREVLTSRRAREGERLEPQTGREEDYRAPRRARV